MPLVMVWMRASTMEAPPTASAPAIWLNRPGWSAVWTVTSVTARSSSTRVRTVSGAPVLSLRASGVAWRAWVSGSKLSQ